MQSTDDPCGVRPLRGDAPPRMCMEIDSVIVMEASCTSSFCVAWKSADEAAAVAAMAPPRARLRALDSASDCVADVDTANDAAADAMVMFSV